MISVIIPVYNTEKYLPRCIDSILNSTYSNFEIILIDDGSSDKSPGICEEYREKDPRIKVVHQKNQGVSAARNAGIERSTGEWLIFVDSDDYISPDFLGMIAREQYQDKELLLFEFTTSEDMRRDNSIKTRTFRRDQMHHLLRRILIPEQIFPGRHADFRSPCARAYKKSLIDQYSIRFSPDIAIGEDLLFNMEYQLRAASCVYLAVPVYFYDIHEGSATHGFRTVLIENHAHLQVKLKTLLEQCNIFSSLEQEFYSYSLENMTYVLIWEIFNPLNPAAYRTKCRLCSEIQKNRIYRDAMKHNLRSGILPRKVLVFFFRLGCYPLTSLICHISYKYLGGQ